MHIPDTLLTMYSGEIEDSGGSPTIAVPERELQIGDLEVGETYRVAILPGSENSSVGPVAPSDPDRARSQPRSEPPVEEGDTCEVEVEDIGDQGDGIARIGPGYIVFVPDTDIGDRVTVEITQALENFAFGEVVEGEPVS